MTDADDRRFTPAQLMIMDHPAPLTGCYWCGARKQDHGPNDECPVRAMTKRPGRAILAAWAMLLLYGLIIAALVVLNPGA